MIAYCGKMLLGVKLILVKIDSGAKVRLLNK